MSTRLRQTLAAAAGVILFDYFFCQVSVKALTALGILEQPAKACACGCAGQNECKNVTDYSQVIDVTPVNQIERLQLLN